MNPVTVADLTDRWRLLPDEDIDTAAALLDDAWAVITTLEPTVQARFDSGALPLATLRAVVSAMVLRALKNPDGKLSEKIDDYSWTRDKTISGGVLYLSDDERLLLRVRRARAFEITPATC